MRIVPCKELTPDMQLARNVYKHGCIFLKAGLRDINRYQRNLEKLGVYYVYITDKDSVGIDVPDVIAEETREKCKTALMGTFADFARKNVVDVERISYPVSCLMNDILKNQEMQISLSDISITDEYTFGHSVSTAVYASLIGIQFGYNEKELYTLAMGALLHDIGKTMLNGNILYKEGKLDEKEYEYIKLHSTLGYDSLKRSKDIPEEAKLIALNHHERLDGTGYPNGLKNGQIDTFSKIVAVADVYDALTSTRCYREKWKLNMATDFLVKNAGTQLDTESVRFLLKKIAMYPNGTKVWLSNDKAAIVKSQNRNMPHCPVVRVIEEHGKHIAPYEIDLAKDRSVSIIAM